MPSQTPETPGFVTWQVRSNPTLGEYLRNVREQKRLRLVQISKKINVKESYLESIEKGSYDKLPASVYTKGFIRSYAAFLHVDQELALRLYERERKIRANVTTNNTKPKLAPVSFPNPILAMNPRTLLAAFVGVLVLSSLIYLWNQFSRLADPPQLVIDQPSDHLVLQNSSLEIHGSADVGSSVYINGQIIEIDDRGQFSEQVSLQNGLNSINVVARNKFGSERSVNREVIANLPQDSVSLSDAAATAASAATPALTLPPGENRGVDLVLSVDNQATWVSVQSDGQERFTGTMLAGSKRSFHAQDQITMSSSNTANTRVEFNGHTITDFGQTGAIRDLVFTHDLEVKDHGKIVMSF